MSLHRIRAAILSTSVINKATVFTLALIPFLRLFYLALNNKLTAHPIEYIEHSTGFWSLTIMLVLLCLTPLRLIFKTNKQIRFRRMLGLFVFFYAFVHVMTYLWLDYAFSYEEIAKDVIKHPRIWVGFIAFLLLIPLAITSNRASIKRLGASWVITQLGLPCCHFGCDAFLDASEARHSRTSSICSCFVFTSGYKGLF